MMAMHWTYADVKNRTTVSHNVEITAVFWVRFIVYYYNCGSLGGGGDLGTGEGWLRGVGGLD